MIYGAIALASDGGSPGSRTNLSAAALNSSLETWGVMGDLVRALVILPPRRAPTNVMGECQSRPVGRRKEARPMVAAGIQGHEVAGRAFDAVHRDPEACEVDHHAVVLPDLGRKFLGEEATKSIKSDILGQEMQRPVSVMGCEDLGDALRVGNRSALSRYASRVMVDSNHDGVVLTNTDEFAHNRLPTERSLRTRPHNSDRRDPDCPARCGLSPGTIDYTSVTPAWAGDPIHTRSELASAAICEGSLENTGLGSSALETIETVRIPNDR